MAPSAQGTAVADTVPLAQYGEDRMTVRERVTIAMHRGAPDRVPVIPQICHPHAIRFFGLEFEEAILDCVRRPERVNELHFECARAYGVDGVRVWPVPSPVETVEIGGVWHGRDPETGVVKGVVDFRGGGWVIDADAALLESDEDIEAVVVRSAAEILASGELDCARRLVNAAGDDLFVISAPGAFTVEYLTFQRGKQQALMDILERPEFCHRAQEKALAVAVQNALALAAIGIHGIMIADTFAGVIGPARFTEFCLPYFRRFVETMDAELGDRRPIIYLHICGNSTEIFELMADTGVDCIETLDPLGGVRVSDAKERVGTRVALMGGVNTLTLAHGSLDETRTDVDRCLREGAPEGGYILAAGDMLPTETAPEKVRAMLDQAEAWRY